MAQRKTASAALVAAATLLLGSASADAQDLGYRGDLTAGIPGPNAEFQSLDAIPEGGLHFLYVTVEDPEALPWVFQYRAALQEAGWTITDLGGGGNPFGSSGGAKLTAEHADGRYLRLNAGHPGEQHLDHAPSIATFIDGCVWPNVPADDTCHHLRHIDIGNLVAGSEQGVGAMGDLAAGIPEPKGAEYQSEDAVQEGGRHFYYLSPDGHFAEFSDYLTALSMAGWTIAGVDTVGDVSGGRGIATATDGSRHLTFNAGGRGVVAHLDVCVWPQEPSDAHCPQSASS